MKATQVLMDIICQTLLNPDVLERALVRKGAFSRNCGKLPYPRVVMLLIKNVKLTLSASLDEFFSKLNDRCGGSVSSKISCSQQAFSKARSAFSHTVFKECFDRMLDCMCSPESHSFDKRLFGMWGIQAVAIDGSDIDLPNRHKLLIKYGGTGRGAASPTARASIAYDVFNHRIIDAQLEPLAVDERTLAKRHIGNLKDNDRLDFMYTMFIFDRGYASDDLISYIEDDMHGCYLFRLRSKFNTDIDALPEPCDAGIADYTIDYHGRKVRVLKFKLTSGIVETLITNRFGLDREMFRTLYFLRWPVEPEYDFVKDKIGLENFRGYSENSVLQEFWISVILANLASAIKMETDGIIDFTTNRKGNKHMYETNANELIGHLSRHFDDYIDLYLDNGSVKDKFMVIKDIYAYAISHRVVDKRGMGESNPRNTPRNVKHHYNRKATH